LTIICSANCLSALMPLVADAFNCSRHLMNLNPDS